MPLMFCIFPSMLLVLMVTSKGMAGVPRASLVVIAATLAQYPAMCTEVPLETARAVMAFRPDAVVHQIAPRPILFIVGDNDGLCLNDLTRDLYTRAGDPKGWIELPGCGHYDAYTPAYLPRVLEETSAWFDRYLRGGTHAPRSSDAA